MKLEDLYGKEAELQTLRAKAGVVEKARREAEEALKSEKLDEERV